MNVFVFNLTGSPAAVAGLWIMGPLGSLITSFWSGSFIDRMNKRTILIFVDVLRGVFVCLIPFVEVVWLIYVILLILSICKAFFHPASLTYLTMLIPEKDRKRYNSFRSLIMSSAFLIGPAIAGILLISTSTSIAIWINGASFLLSALILSLLPNVDLDHQHEEKQSIHFQVLKKDWQAVIQFSKQHVAILSIYMLNVFFMLVSLGMDAQEVVFTRDVIYLSETEYGLLISITGVGSIVGASVVSAIANKVSIKQLMGVGYFLSGLGYFIYGISFSFWSIAIGFVILGFFTTFYSTGFLTFYQNNVPSQMMGRISSVFGTLQSVMQIISVLLIGFTGELIPLRTSIIVASVLAAFHQFTTSLSYYPKVIPTLLYRVTLSKTFPVFFRYSIN
ncbi:MFS transporter [Bacillus carboniphilus]|uniref:MFS transporter n=1 Tax=Bacillus carboniphilus TaxID=86663 RepID=A0ABY9K002_9BACI|nr:MFS transporter [Bacillus carboniphilus]WLR44354.1 MFS transporter [Bacillus carboniphilus]